MERLCLSEYINFATDFRDKINEFDYQLTAISNRIPNSKGKKPNYWACLCSIMDWIDISMNCFLSFDLDEKKNQTLDDAMFFYSYICSIDIARMCVQKLSFVFDYVSTVVDGDFIFHRKYFDKNDIETFEMYRALFGAHPVDIKNGIGKTTKRYYASWPFKNIVDSSGDYGIMLYNNDDNEELKITVSVKELDLFMIKNIDELKRFIVFLKGKIDEIYHIFRNTPIVRKENVIEQINILIDENKKRINNYFLEENLQRAKDMIILEKLGNKYVDGYLDLVKKEVEKSFTYLQNIPLDDCPDFVLFYSNKFELGYEFKCLIHGEEYLHKEKFRELLALIDIKIDDFFGKELANLCLIAFYYLNIKNTRNSNKKGKDDILDF